MKTRFFRAALLILSPLPMLAHADIVSMGSSYYGVGASQAASYSLSTETGIPLSAYDNSCCATTSDSPGYAGIDPLSSPFNGVTLTAGTSDSRLIGLGENGSASATATLLPTLTLTPDIFQLSNALYVAGNSAGRSIYGGTNSISSGGVWVATYFTVLSPVQYSLTSFFTGGSDDSITHWSLQIIGSSVNIDSCAGAEAAGMISSGYCSTPTGAFSANGTLMPGEYRLQDVLAGQGSNTFDNVEGSGFIGSAGFTLTLTPTTVPVPAAAWLFGSGLLGLVGIGRRKAA